MTQNFRCRLVNESGHVLKINLPGNHPAWMDMLNTLCGAKPVEWIGRNSHDKVIQITRDFKNRMIRICDENKDAQPNLDDLERFLNDQPDDCFVSFLREGYVVGDADNRIDEAVIRALAANYKSEVSNRGISFNSDSAVKQDILKTIFCITSEGDSWTYRFPRNFPEERRSMLFEQLHVATDMSMPAMRDGKNFWRINELRKHAKSQTVVQSEVGSLITSLVKRLKDLGESEFVVFGVLQLADETQLTYIKQACSAAKSDGSHRRFYDQQMAKERLFCLEGYTHRSFTDVGFSHAIAGRRICRFCGRGTTDGVTFKKDPHAISFFWGNHYLLGAGECDVCNGKFGNTLEPQALRYYLPTMINCGMTGRGKDPKAVGQNFALRLGTMRILSTETDNLWERLCNGEEVSQGLDDSQPVIKADIYRCFCKYVVSLINDEELPDFKETIRWIMKERLSGKSLPPTLRNETDLGLTETPTIEIFAKKASDKSPISYIIAFRFITNLWLFAIPYVRGIENARLKKELLDFQKRFYPYLNFVQEDFSIEVETYTTTHFGLSISGETEMKRVCDMTPEERNEFFRNMPKQWHSISSAGMNQKG